jgi:HEAT repeats
MTKYTRNFLLSPCLALFLAAGQPLLARTLEPVPTTPTTDEDNAYTAGTRAMDAQHWADAVTAFDKVVNVKGRRADAALYWKAYSLNKLGKVQLASATCDQLRSQYAGSTWNRDCMVLSIEAHAATVAGAALDKMELNLPSPESSRDLSEFNASPAPGSDEDLKMLALNSLLHQDPARAIPLLRDILSGNQSDGLKRHALFVLAQSKSPEAQGILHDAAIGKMDPDLQRQAIQSMAIFQGKRANDTLVEVYHSTSDPRIKRSIISALFITHDAPRMVELARNEKDLELKRSIVSQLALMNDKAATDYMMELLK